MSIFRVVALLIVVTTVVAIGQHAPWSGAPPWHSPYPPIALALGVLLELIGPWRQRVPAPRASRSRRAPAYRSKRPTARRGRR